MRYLSDEIERMLSVDKKMAFISGPRQAGKTTLARYLLHKKGQDLNYFNWDIESHRKLIIKNPERFWQLKPPSDLKQEQRVVLDEIHKYPRWKRFLKGLYDFTDKKAEILVTGSGRLDIYQRGGDSLFGRYFLYRLHPFTLGELLSSDRRTVRTPEVFWKDVFSGGHVQGAAEGLAAIDRFTGFPEPLFSASETKLRRWRRSRSRLVIREDLQDLTRIRDIGLLETLATLLPERVGSPLSLNSLSGDLGVAFHTVQLWVKTLARLYYLFEIRPYAGRLARSLRKEAKIFLFDFTEIEAEGPRFENLAALHLRKLCDSWNDFGYGDFALHYVRDKEKREVDFLISESGKPYALIETKISGREISPHLFRFASLLKPKYAVQLVRDGGELSEAVSGTSGNPGPGEAAASGGIYRISASRFLPYI